MTVREWFDMWERKMEHLDRAYEYRFRNLPVNKAGETNAESLLKLNKWVEGERARIKTMMKEMVPNLIAE